MKKAFFLLLVFITACAPFQRRIEVEWPPTIDYVEAIGGVDISWRRVNYNGSISLKMEYPDVLSLDIYGPFGQTLAYLRKERDSFLFVSGENKSTDEETFEQQYGLTLRQFMDDLAMRGERTELEGATRIARGKYMVIYGQDRLGRRTICWKGIDGSICLTLSEVSFRKEESGGKGSSGKM